MTFDGILVRAVIKELKEKILPGSIKKINQIGRGQITIQIYANGENYLLYLSISPSDGGFHLSEKKYKNPDTAPNLVMFLRKHIGKARLIDISQEGLDRTVRFKFLSRDDLADEVDRFLVLELMGRHSNLILLDEKDSVLEAVRRVSYDMSRFRQVYPGSKYKIFPSDKLDILTEDYDIDFLIKRSMEKNPDNFSSLTCKKLFYPNITGFSPLISDHLLALSDLSPDRTIISLSNEEKDLLNKAFINLVQTIKSSNFKAYAYMDKGQAYPIELAQFPRPDHESSSISKLLDMVIPDKKSEDTFNREKRSYIKTLANGMEKKIRKLKRLEEDYEDTLSRGEIKEKADLLAANAHLVQRGQREIIVSDFFNDGKDRKINLDEKKSGHENMDALYKKFAKLNTAHKLLEKSIPQIKEEIRYYEQINSMLERSDSEADLIEIRKELEREGLLKNRGKKATKKKEVKSGPLKFESPNGFLIMVGKNNFQNDRITLKVAGSDDYFLHVKQVAGSHVILRSAGMKVPIEDIEAAAWLAAKHSSRSNEMSVDVDYCLKKDVYKAKGAKPGMVYYNNYKTIHVNMEAEARVKKLD